MREIERETEQTTAFKKDLRREGKGPNLATLNAVLPEILAGLVNDIPLDTKYKDHALTGNWEGCRDCHVKYDLVLIYEKIDNL